MSDEHRPARRLQVFVSSTYTDLVEERQAAVAAILKAGHIPAGMELFTAGDRSQLKTIERWIDESDVYLLVLGGRYGSIEPISGLSYTELEYDYAISQEKSSFAVVIHEDALEKKARRVGTHVLEKENQGLLKKFRARVLTKISAFFRDCKDIKISVHESLARYTNNPQLVGWVSGTELRDQLRLREEVTSLRRATAALTKEVSSLEAKLEFNISDPNLDEFLRVVNVFQVEFANLLRRVPTGSVESADQGSRIDATFLNRPRKGDCDINIRSGQNVNIPVGEATRADPRKASNITLGRSGSGICIVADGRISPSELVKLIGNGGGKALRLRVTMSDPERTVELNLGKNFEVTPEQIRLIRALPGVSQVLSF